jgi:hypothetical protein
MHSTRKTLTRCGLWAMLVVALAAGSAGAAHRKKTQSKQASCMDSCNENNDQKMRACMKSCPTPRQGKMDQFQACTQHCSASMKTDTCYERCSGEDGKHHGH